jgi:hypothetical protein
MAPGFCCVQAVRQWTGCQSLRGAALEDEGGGGTMGSHWEMLYFPVGPLAPGPWLLTGQQASW